MFQPEVNASSYQIRRRYFRLQRFIRLCIEMRYLVIFISMLLYEYKDECIEIRIYDTIGGPKMSGNFVRERQRIVYILEYLTIYCFVFLLKMRPWGSFQVNEATNVVFMILGGCFISQIVLNLSFRWVKKILVKSDSMFTLACEQVLHVRVSQSKRWTINFH